MAPFLMVASDFIKTGGMDRANYALADYLARQGAEVHLVGYSAGQGLRGRANVHFHPVAKPLGSEALGWGRLDRAGRHWARQLAGRGGRVLVNGGNCRWGDINWVHYVHAAYAATVAGGPLDRAWQGWKYRRARRDERRAMPRARFVIANSERTRRDLVERLGLEAARVHTVYYGCDAAMFAPPSEQERELARRGLGLAQGRATAIFVGALGDRRKGFDTLLAAWQRLGRADWPADLLVAGRGRELEAWQERVRQAGLAGSIRFLGFRTDMARLLAACDVLVSPTRYEAYGLGVQEALARGLPAIVSAEAGVAERLPATLQALCLQDPESATELADRLLAWRAAASDYARAARQLSATLHAHTWDHMCAQLLAIAGLEAA